MVALPTEILLASAEIRAFYFGTMGMLSVVFARGGRPASSSQQRREALALLGGVLGLFVVGRGVSFLADGLAHLSYSNGMWAVEAGGACAAAVLWADEKRRNPRGDRQQDRSESGTKIH
jgi:hypothetical protein